MQFKGMGILRTGKVPGLHFAPWILPTLEQDTAEQETRTTALSCGYLTTWHYLHLHKVVLSRKHTVADTKPKQQK